MNIKEIINIISVCFGVMLFIFVIIENFNPKIDAGVKGKNYTVHSLSEGDKLIKDMLNSDSSTSCKKIKFGGIDIAYETITIQHKCITEFAAANNESSLLIP